MNFQEIINEELSTESDYILEEGIFKINPAIAYFVFKDNVVEKVNKAKQKAKDLELDAKQKIEKVKAKYLGRSGDSDNDTIYSYTKEQKQVLAQIYKKYGSEIIKQINDFRINVMAPYQVIKREVAKNYMTSDKERFGMTKEEYYRYRESGRRKIEKSKTYFKDSKEMNEKQEAARKALVDARKALDDFKNNNNFNLSAVNIDKIFDEAGIGLKALNGWSMAELAMTSNEIERLEEILKKGPSSNGKYKIRGSERTGSADMLTRDEIEYRISALREKGISNVNNKPNKNNNRPFGSFKEAFSIYLLRKEEIQKIRNKSSFSEYRKLYEKVLKDGITSAQKIYDDKFNNYMKLKSTITLNQYEKKIWEKKFLGNKYSGDINDWKLKIKPEDFKGVEYKEKSPKILKAEKDIDRELKRFERKLLKIMDSEDVDLCKKYRLFNNFLTVKQLKDPENMFKKGDIKMSNYDNEEEIDAGELEEKIDSIIEKDYDSIKELENAQEKLKDLIKGEKINSETKTRCDKFLKKLNPKNTNEKKSEKKSLEEYLEKVINTEYSKTSAINELKTLNDKISDFEKLNGEGELKQFVYNINKAKDKLNLIIRDED